MTKVAAAAAESDKSNRQQFDLEERTAHFGEAVIAFAKKIPRTGVTLPLISQFVRAGTSIGSNYCEADDAVSKKEFHHKIGTCKKEARETKYWLRIIAAADPALKEDARALWQEAKELHLTSSFSLSSLVLTHSSLLVMISTSEEVALTRRPKDRPATFVLSHSSFTRYL